MRTILVIGIGAGNPDFLTVQAIKALNRAEVFLIPDKGEAKGGLNRLRGEILTRYATERAWRTHAFAVPERRVSDADYGGSIEDWRSRLEAEHERAIVEAVPEGGCGAFLVWGDPALYDGTLVLMERLRARGLALEIEVIAGISAVQALAAAHRVPLNRVGEPVLVTTARRLAADPDAAPENVVVMLESDLAFRGFDPEAEIYWGAYLGTPDEILISGRLGDVAAEIEQRRAEARERHGWVMDTYLLRRPGRD